MKLYFLAFFSVAVLLFSSCGEDVVNEVNLTFTPSYGEENFELGKKYELNDGVAISLLKSGYYFSDISATDKSGKRIELSDVELVEFENNNTVSFNYSIGEVEGLRELHFGIGVSSDLNETVPEDYELTHPLAANDYYWPAWESYIFTKTEGQYDKDLDGELDNSFVFHTGSDTVYQELTIDISDIEANEDGVFQLDLSVDHHKMLNPNDEAMDIDSAPVIHNADNLDILYNYVNAIKNSISIYNE